MIDIQSLNKAISMTVQDSHGIKVTPDLADTIVLQLGFDTVRVMRIDDKWTIFHNSNVKTKKVSKRESMKPVMLE